MKVAWFSHHREGSGWGEASIKSILALDSVGVDVVPVSVPLTGKNAEVPARIAELEKGSIGDADYCVQNVLPHHMIGTDQFKKNIGYFVTETRGMSHMPWVSQLEAMDELWVPNEDNVNNVLGSIKHNSVKCVPYAFDRADYEGFYETLDMGAAKDSYKFYYIGDMNDRKNIEATIRCYQAAFKGSPNVTLVLKVGMFGKTEEEIGQIASDMIMRVNTSLRMFNDQRDYCNIVVIPHNMPRQHILNLHHTCDCYVSTSHGEGWNIPAYEAFCMGNPVIAGNEGGPRDFLPEGMPIRGSYSPCTHRDAAFEFIGTGYETWFNIDEDAVVGSMLECYVTQPNFRKEGAAAAAKYSLESVGNIMKASLQA